jgi:hypothetical protein
LEIPQSKCLDRSFNPKLRRWQGSGFTIPLRLGQVSALLRFSVTVGA